MAIKIELIKYIYPHTFVSLLNFSYSSSLKEFIINPKKYPHNVTVIPDKILEIIPNIIK